MKFNLEVRVSKKEVTLEDLPNGSLFLYDGCIALKSEYGGTCYIVGSGERFWGGVSNEKELGKLKVHRIKLKEEKKKK